MVINVELLFLFWRKRGLPFFRSRSASPHGVARDCYRSEKSRRKRTEHDRVRTSPTLFLQCREQFRFTAHDNQVNYCFKLPWSLCPESTTSLFWKYVALMSNRRHCWKVCFWSF